jgi:hypothetical protein
MPRILDQPNSGNNDIPDFPPNPKNKSKGPNERDTSLVGTGFAYFVWRVCQKGINFRDCNRNRLAQFRVSIEPQCGQII